MSGSREDRDQLTVDVRLGREIDQPAIDGVRVAIAAGANNELEADAAVALRRRGRSPHIADLAVPLHIAAKLERTFESGRAKLAIRYLEASKLFST